MTDREEIINMIDEVGPALAKALGPAWRFLPDGYKDGDRTERYTRFDLRNQETSITLSASHNWRSELRFTFRGVYPGGHDSRDPSITLDINRPVARLAADIKRRLLPDAERIYKKRFAQQANTDAERCRLYDTIQQIALALGGDEPHPPQGYARDSRTLQTSAGQYGTTSTVVEAYPYDGRISITISARNLPLQEALQIAHILRGVHMQQTAGK